MPYDESLVKRIESILKPRRGITQNKMFRGLCFL